MSIAHSAFGSHWRGPRASRRPARRADGQRAFRVGRCGGSHRSDAPFGMISYTSTGGAGGLMLRTCNDIAVHEFACSICSPVRVCVRQEGRSSGAAQDLMRAGKFSPRPQLCALPAWQLCWGPTGLRPRGVWTCCCGGAAAQPFSLSSVINRDQCWRCSSSARPHATLVICSELPLAQVSTQGKSSQAKCKCCTQRSSHFQVFCPLRPADGVLHAIHQGC